MADYHINVFASAEDAGYIADIPDLPHCSAFGLTPQDALREVLLARDAYLQTLQESGRPVPVPRYRPAIDASA